MRTDIADTKAKHFHAGNLDKLPVSSCVSCLSTFFLFTEQIICIVIHFEFSSKCHQAHNLIKIHIKTEVLFKTQRVPLDIDCSACKTQQMFAPRQQTPLWSRGEQSFRSGCDGCGLKCVFALPANLRAAYHCSHQMGALSLKSFSEAWMTLVLSQARMLAPRKKPTSQ